MNWLIELVFPRRLHRLSYFLRGLLADFLGYYLFACSTTMNPQLWWPAVVAVIIYQYFFIMLPRLRDIEMSAWWLLVTCVPFVNIWLGIILQFRPPALLHPAEEISPATA